MNETNPNTSTPSALAPVGLQPPPVPQFPPANISAGIGHRPSVPPDPSDFAPITTFSGALEALLRSPTRVLHQLGRPGGARLTLWLGAVSLVTLAIYGVLLGSFSMHEQLWAAPLKVTLGLLACGVICLPSLYVFACLSGAHARLGEIVGLLAGLLALTGLLLVSFGPVAWVFSQSTDAIGWMGFLHLSFWVVATGFGLRFLHAGFRQFQARSPGIFTVWTILFLVVVLQMSTALRPLLGRAPTLLPTEKKFFLTHWGESLENDNRLKR